MEVLKGSKSFWFKNYDTITKKPKNGKNGKKSKKTLNKRGVFYKIRKKLEMEIFAF